MGRRPTPTKLKELAGNPGKRQLNKAEPKPRCSRPKMPAAFKGTAKETQWRRLSRELAGMGLLSSADADALALYCDVYVRWAEAVRALEQEGMIVFTDKGFPVQSPYLGIVNTCTTRMQRLLIEFGMTPAARSRVTAPDKEASDPFDNFLQRRGG